MLENIIDWQARRGPDRPAIWLDGSALTYGVFAHHIALMTTALERENLPPGVVLIATPTPALHWLLTLAFERLGFTTACELIKPKEVATAVRAAAVVTTNPALQIDGVRMLYATADWRRRALAGSASTRRSHGAADDVVRIVLSSGTTGERKPVAISRGVMDSRLCRPQMFEDLKVRRAFSTMGLDTIGGFQRPLISWLSGGSMVMTNEPVTDTFFHRSTRPTEVMASPANLRHLLPLMRGAYTGDDPVRIRVGGSAIPPSLLEQSMAESWLELCISYGSTEGGSVAGGLGAMALRRPGAVGHVTPWTEVEIVDEKGTPLPAGTSGIIRVRGPDVALGHTRDGSVYTAFEDGWFYPNDIGHLESDGVLVVDGRKDDVINIGGVKLSSTRVEETLLGCGGVKDAAVAAFQMTGGMWALHAAIVCPGAYAADDLRQAVKDAHGVPIRLVEVEAIPRNGMGKIVRSAVKLAILKKARTALIRPDGVSD